MSSFLNPSARRPGAGDLALLVARLAVGIILMAHGWQKYAEWTIAGTAASFQETGVPYADIAAQAVTWLELAGGAALALGVLTPLIAALNAVSVVGALVLVHAESGVFVEDGGFELVLALFAVLFILALKGAGRFSVDGLLSRSVRA